MKKAVSLLSMCCLLLVLSLVPTFCAADSSVRIEELGMTISVPDGLYVITRETDADFPVWKNFIVTRDEFMNEMESQSMYLDAIDPDISYEIVVSGLEGDNYSKIFNMSLYDEKEIYENLSEAVRSSAKEEGLMVLDDSIYKSGDLTYYCMTGVKPSSARMEYIKSYGTIVNGKSIQITLHTYGDSIDTEKSEMIKAIADSAHFDEIQKKPVSFSGAGSILGKGLLKGLGLAAIAFVVSLIKIINKGKQAKGTNGNVNGTIMNNSQYPGQYPNQYPNQPGQQVYDDYSQRGQ